MYELLEALDVAVVEELLLEERPGGLRGGALWRCHRHIARGRHLELAVDAWRKWFPRIVRVGRGAETTSEESSHSQIPVAEAKGIAGEAEEIRRGLIIESIPRIEGQSFICRAEAGEARPRTGGITVVGLSCGQRRSSSPPFAALLLPPSFLNLQTPPL